MPPGYLAARTELRITTEKTSIWTAISLPDCKDWKIVKRNLLGPDHAVKQQGEAKGQACYPPPMARF
jgi:hypothetical protein